MIQVSKAATIMIVNKLPTPPLPLPYDGRGAATALFA